MSKRLFVVVFLILCFMHLPHAEAEEKITLSTYYPAPYGEYNSLSVGNGYAAPLTDGNLIVEGNVGIGTTTPSRQLHVYSDRTAYGCIEGGSTGAPARRAILELVSSDANRAQGILTKDGSTEGWFFGEPYMGDGFTVGYGSSQPEYLAQSKLYITTDGNVGIGTTNPRAKLDILANTSTWGGWYEAIRFSQSAHSAITHPGGGLLFGLHGNRNYYWADTINGWYAMTLNANGNLIVRGNLSKGSGSFLIDHPLDPKNKVLRHSFIEGPEPVLIYKGRARLENGQAVIQLPDYFDDLAHPKGREINLTCIDNWSPLYLDGEISENSFTIKTTARGHLQQKFSWVVYAVRNDAFIQKNPIIIEEEKGAGNEFTKGEYIYPEAFDIIEK
jgi:hypothetical protein